MAESIHERVAELLDRSRQWISQDQRLSYLHEIIDLYEQLPAADAESAAQLRLAFLQTVQESSENVIDERFSTFLAQKIEPEDFAGLQWNSPYQAFAFYDLLYGLFIADTKVLERIQSLMRILLKGALQQFERQGEMEKVFTLFRLVPSSSILDDGDLRRLRNRAYLYEMHRVQRHRRFLYGYLILQVILVMIVFPLLFINAENGQIQAQLNEAVQGQANQVVEDVHFYTYREGLYWALITAASIGYGDITPGTGIGRAISAILGVMGVITVGVIAGLILDWVSPRSLD